MIDLGHVAIMMLVGIIGTWIWRGMGLRERALRLVRRHCENAGVQLLDESIGLNRLRVGRGPFGRPGIVRRYGFEFTVTGERRYTGFIELHGANLRKIKLSPHPFPDTGPQDPPHNDIQSNVHSLH